MASGIVQLDIRQVKADNRHSLFDAKVGALGDALARAGYHRAVIANGDGSEPWTVDAPLPVHERAAAVALMGSNGVVPGGRVDTGLLVHDPAAPFGLRLDPDAVETAFTDAWTSKSVVLVEASDLLRADEYSRFATPTQAAALLRQAIVRTDELVGRLLEHVDLSRDAVLVAGTSGSSARRGVTLMSVASPGRSVGLLRSATTRRTGFVQLVDIAPTMLDLLGVRVPDVMKGRPMVARRTATIAVQRERFIVNTNRDGVFRDENAEGVRRALIFCAIALGLLALLVLTRWPRGARFAEWAALGLLAFLIATHLAAPFHFARHGGIAAYLGFSVCIAGLIAVGALAVGRRRPYDPLIVVLGIVVAVHLLDLFTGARLQLNTMLGYSATNGIRLVGEGNLTFAVLGSALMLLCGLLCIRHPSRRTMVGCIGLLVVTLLAMAGPAWGQDYGAAIAGAPAFALLGWLLLGRRITPRGVLALAAVLLVSGAVFGGVDLLRPASQQTHVGRFFNRVRHEGLHGLVSVLRRKANTNIHSFTNSILAWLLPFALAALVALWRPRRGGIRAFVLGNRTACMTLVSVLVFSLLGYALNDSGVAIPAMIALVVECAAVFVAARHVRRPELVPPEPIRRPLPVVSALRRAIGVGGLVEPVG